MTENVEAELVAISELAQERRERATPSLARALPDVIKSIHRAEVAYTIEPRWLPLPYVDVERLIARLKVVFGLSLDGPDISPLVPELPREELIALSPFDAVGRLFRSRNCLVVFRNGRFATGRDDFVPILSVRMTREQILVAVEGVGEVAELVVAEIVELLWECAGAPKRWDAIKPNVQLIGYATATYVDLGLEFETLLSPAVRKFMNDNVTDGERYADHVGDYLAHDDFGPPPGSFLRWAAEEIDFVLFRFDTRNGRRQQTALKFSVANRSSYGSGRLLVSSELPFHKHVACVAELAEALRAQGAPSHP